jgi:hypothetical protein
MPIIRYFEVTEIRTIRVQASTIPDAILVAEAGFNDSETPKDVEGSIRRGPVVIEMHAVEEK